MSYHRDPASDPFLSAGGSDSEEADSEAEAWRYRPDDLLVLAARNEDDVSHLEVTAAAGRLQRSSEDRGGWVTCCAF
jgi:hypothetical protein